MSCKRAYTDQDPDYENNLSNDQKRLKVIEKDNKKATIRKIEQIITTQFNHEIKLKEAEVKEIDDRLYQALKMLDQLRVCIITQYYSFDKQSETAVTKISGYQPPIHPTVKKYLGKRPTGNAFSTSGSSSLPSTPINNTEPPDLSVNKQGVANVLHPKPSPQVTLAASSSSQAVTSESSCEETSSRASRFKIRKRIIVGNVSKYIPVDKREERDQSTHKWMIYVRGTKEEPYIESFVKKVWFFLHPSYRPNDLVEVNQPPFHLTRRGWGEFPVRTQLHFHDVRNKRVDIIHTLKLDKTYTGLQTLGAETVVDILIYKPELLPCSLDEDGALETRQSPNKDIDMGGYVIAHNEDDKSRVVTSENVAVSGCETPAKALHCRNPHMVFTGVPSPTEISEEDGQKGKNCDDKFVSSFINDHGAYFATSNIDIVKSEHSYQAECPSLENCAGEKPLNTDIVNVTSYSEKLVRIKEEPLEETDRNDSCYSLKLNQKLNSSNVCSDTINQFKISQSLDELGCNSKLLVGDEDMVDISKSLNLEVNALVSSSKHNSTLMSDINIKPESDVEKDEKAESEIVYSVPGHHMLSFSEGSSVATNVVPDNQNLHQQNSINSLSLSSCTCVSSGNSSVSSSSISDLKEFDKDKTVSQSQSTNGVTTFVKCVDKQGNLYLIPLTVFLKMNPGAQLSAPPNSTHFSNLSSPSSSACSSLLKTSRVGGNIPASSTTTNATPLIMVSGISSGIKTMSDIPSIITSNSTSLGPACQKLTSSSPSVVTFPSALNAQGTSQQSLLLSNSKMPNIIQTSGLPRSLLSQHSISLLSGVSKLKKSQSVNNFSTSTSKTMISCLAKSRHTVEKVLPSGTLPLRINVDSYDSMDQIVRRLGKVHPLIAADLDRSKFPYCAPSLNEFLNWNIGKRHAAEWQRARAVRNELLQLVQESQQWKKDDVWSVKNLFIWYRHYGYSPMKLSEIDDNGCDDNTLEKPNLVDEPEFFTYSENKELLDELWKENESLMQNLQNPKDEEIIDVVTIDEKAKKELKTPEKLNSQPVLHFPSTPQGEFVREVAEQIGIKLSPEPVEKDIVAPVAEEVLVAAMKRFVEDIMSTAVAVAFEDTDTNRCPRQLTLLNVGKAICKTPHCDFLTHKYLGTKISKQNIIHFDNIKL